MPKTNTAAHFIAQELARGKKPNRLIHEKSPYLLQHAFNPVDWRPWGEEAFAEARAADKPIFLSIGYSTCHWCHVMDRESFADPETAVVLNRYFVCIKVDREERPDVDQIYMSATQALTGGGGWPMSVFLTPDRQPFYAGTYFPPESRHGLPGFRQLLESVHRAWLGDQAKILQSAGNIAAQLQKISGPASAVTLEETIFEKGFRLLVGEYDAAHGGFGRAPKFPRPVVLHFLLRFFRRSGDEKALEMVLVTLRRMAAGGIYDHVGGGFHRYSVDEQWRVPHFEKMLHDQGQLAVIFLEAHQVSHDPFYANLAGDILDYVLRDMTGPAGGFYSAEDADSPAPDNPDRHGEGLFYLWQEQEIFEALGPELGAVFAYHYGVEREGNAFVDPHGEFGGRNILYVARGLEETAAYFGRPVKEVEEFLDAARDKLFAARAQRLRPHLDDKVITAWNGQMISAFARGYQVLGDARYGAAAERAAAFILAELYDPATKTLLRRYRDGEAGLAAQLDDYVFLVQGLLDLYEACFNVGWLQDALDLTVRQLDLFSDNEAGGFFDISGQDTTLLFRMKSDYDGAEPTGNSIAALNLLRLAQITDNADWRGLAEKTVAAFASRLNEYPLSLPQLLSAHDFSLRKPMQIVIAGKPGAADTQEMLREIHARFLPDKVVLLADSGEGQEMLGRYLPFVRDIAGQDKAATAYVCRNYACSPPVAEAAGLGRQLESMILKK